MSRYLNAKLRKAIENRWPMVWDYGFYSRYCCGLVLRASSGRTENRRHWRVVFGTQSVSGAKEVDALANEAKAGLASGLTDAISKAKWESRG